MARIRTIKPEFWTDEDIASVSEPARLLAIGILNQADDEGFFKSNPMLLKAAVFPLCEPSMSIQGMINELSNIGYIKLCVGSDGKQYGLVRNFNNHQKVNRPSPSKIKGLCNFNDNSVNPHELLTGGKERKGTGKGTGNREHEESATKRKRFSPPSFQDVSDYFFEKSGNSANAQKFIDFYESKGWMVGKNKMKDWKASVRNWISREQENATPAKQKQTDDYYQQLANTEFR